MKKPLAFLLVLLVFTTTACLGVALPFSATETPAPQLNSTDIARIVQETLAILTPAATAQPAAQTPIPSGETAAAVTPGEPAATSNPAARPPSLLITYTLDGDVYLWQPGGEITRLTDHAQAMDVSISPSGAWIAYTRRVDERHADIWAVRADGAENRQLVSAMDFVSPQPDAVVVPNEMGWQPGTHRLYFNTRLTYTGPGEPASNDLRFVDADNPLDRGELLPAGAGGKFLFSPDAQQILITQGNRFRVANADGSGARDLFTYPEIFTYSEWTYYPDPVWKKDGSAVRVAIPAQDPLTRPDDPTVVWEIPINGSSARSLLSVNAGPAFMYRPLLSPDAKTILYQTQRSETDLISDLHIANIDLGGDWIIHSGNQRLVNWAPDSLRLSILAGDRNEIQVGTVQGVFSGWPVGVKPFALEWADAERVIVLSGSVEAPELYLVALGSRSLLIAQSSRPGLEFDYTQ
ncbi:MAG TPA: hypothetical protein VIO36_12500 [Anaerolineaceae bacterium]